MPILRIIVLAIMLWSCTVEVARSDVRSAGSLAATRDEQLLFAADTDNGLLIVFDAVAMEKIAEVKVGEAPFRVLVANDDTIYVANRRSRSVNVIRRGTWEVAATLQTGIEPMGIVTSSDGSTLYVVSAVALETPRYGTLAAFDTRTLERRWELPVGEEPRDVALRNDGQAIVTLYKLGAVVEVDLAGPSVTSTHELVNGSVHARGLEAVRVAENGTAYGFGLASSVQLPQNLDGGFSGGWGAGPSGPAVFTDEQGWSVGTSTVPQMGATAATIARSDSEAPNDPLFIGLNRETSQLSVSHPRGAVTPLAQVDPGSDGVVLSASRELAYAYSQFTHRLTRIVIQPVRNRPSPGIIDRRVDGATDPLSPQIALGRQLFFSATDERISNGSRIACSTCHLEGRDDGHTWLLPQGERQTPTLAGRRLARTAPYHWQGELRTLGDFYDHTVKTLMGGSGLSVPEQEAISAYLESLPAPENPRRGAAPSAAETRGLIAFYKAECGTCHLGPELTNGLSADIGAGMFDVPSLLGLGRSAPYLHDGSAATLADRFALQPGDQHGTLSKLAPGELADLIAYLETL